MFLDYHYKETTRNQTFTYDALNRLSSGSSSANTGAYSWGENYSIDAWGNLQISPMGGKAHGGTFQLSGNAQNRPTGLAYDAAGNLMSYLSSTYTYDQENRLSSTAGMSYTYDGNGERVLKSNTSTGAAVKRYWSMGGNTLAEGDGSGNLTAEYIYFGGKRVARIDLPGGAVHYYLSDHLNSTSIVVSSSGIPEEESDYSPFGTEYVITGTGVNRYKFTGKERDSETGLDYYGARSYSNAMGRFVSVDWSAVPKPVPYAKFDNPQSLNLYSYALNNPLSNVDLDGHETAAEKEKKIAAAAAAQKGSDAYDIKKTNISNLQIFKNGSDKCNEFVSDTVKSADGTRPVVDGTGKIPTAAQFADPKVKITGLSAPDSMSNSKPGDVIAQDHGPNPNTGNEEGHVGIVVSLPHDGQPGQTASANANEGGKVTVNDWGFRSPTANPNNGERNGASSPAPIVRHPLGDPQ
ncbi:MAG: RHS repeat-associated core domain-containing protein [Candidatus Angelobacter sp.]